MNESVIIPATRQEMIAQLEQLAEIINTAEWSRAALVWSVTTDQVTGRGNRGENGRLSIKKFAELGISGLSSRTSVKKYRNAWKYAIELGVAEDVGPGDRAELPDLDWESLVALPARDRRGGEERNRRARQDVAAMRQAVAGTDDALLHRASELLTQAMIAADKTALLSALIAEITDAARARGGSKAA